MINIEDVQKKQIFGKKAISMLISIDLYNWLNKNNIKKTFLFREACKQIGYIENKISTTEDIFIKTEEKIITPQELEKELYNEDV